MERTLIIASVFLFLPTLPFLCASELDKTTLSNIIPTMIHQSYGESGFRGQGYEYSDHRPVKLRWHGGEIALALMPPVGWLYLASNEWGEDLYTVSFGLTQHLQDTTERLSASCNLRVHSPSTPLQAGCTPLTIQIDRCDIWNGWQLQRGTRNEPSASVTLCRELINSSVGSSNSR